jgi:hypothetical protein
VDRGVAVSIGTVQGKAEAGHEQKTKVKKGELVSGVLPL